MLCNGASGATGFDELWAARESRRTAHPAVGGSWFSVKCAGWPLFAEPTKPSRGDSALQLSGHLDEDVTPHAWAVRARQAVGGTLLTVLDGSHGSLSRLPCAAKAVTFFRTGQTTGGTCPGVQ